MIKQLLNLATTPQMIIENFEGWGSQKPKFLYEISGVSGGVGEGVKPKSHPWQGMDIFWNHILSE